MRKTKLTSYIIPTLPIFFLFLAWELFASIGIINTALFSKPSIILIQLYNIHPVLPYHLLSTLYRLAISFFTALGLGILIGLLMGHKKYIYRFFNPLITSIMTIPGIAMAPLFIVWFGFGDPTIITIGILVAFFPIVYNIAMGVRSVDPQHVRAAKIMGAKKTTLFIHVLLPQSTVHLITGIKLGLARCWRTIIAVEFIAATNYGLGFMIWDAYAYLRVAIVYGGIIILAVIFFTIEKTAIRYLEKTTIEKWGVVQHNT